MSTYRRCPIGHESEEDIVKSEDLRPQRNYQSDDVQLPGSEGHRRVSGVLPVGEMVAVKPKCQELHTELKPCGLQEGHGESADMGQGSRHDCHRSSQVDRESSGKVNGGPCVGQKPFDHSDELRYGLHRGHQMPVGGHRASSEGQGSQRGGGHPHQPGVVGHRYDQRRHESYVVYAERWYILAIFSIFGFLQTCCWNTWGPIEDTAIAVLGWTPGQFALLANWGCITFLITAFFFSWLLHSKGLRVAILLAAALQVTGTALRCIPVPVYMMKWTINIGHIFIGFGGPTFMAAVTTISATWFPSKERTTATALASTFPFLGIASSFLIGPQIVGEMTPASTTISPRILQSDEDEKSQRLIEIRLLMLIEFVLNALMYIAALIYYPATPCTPPTASAGSKREDVKAGMIAIIKKSSFWIPALAYSISTGVFSGWSAQILLIFNNKVDQNTAGWLGFYTNIAALVGGVTVARFADNLGRQMKPMIIVLLVASCASIYWTILLVYDYITYSKASLFASVTLTGLFINSAVPIFFEATVEGAFPIGEETTTMLMTWLFNLFSLVFLILPMVPSLDSDLSWLNWFMLGSTAVCLPLMLFYQERHKRLDFDAAHDRPQENELPE